jgi:hypothetical protein
MNPIAPCLLMAIRGFAARSGNAPPPCQGMGEDVDASVSLECWGLYADCAENTSGFRAQDCHTVVPEDKLLIS